MKRITASLLLLSIFILAGSFTKKEKKQQAFTVTILNKYWTNFRLQVRVGNFTNPERNELKYNDNVKQGGSVPFSTTTPNSVFYRRDANPNNPDGVHFTNWTSVGYGTTIDNP